MQLSWEGHMEYRTEHGVIRQNMRLYSVRDKLYFILLCEFSCSRSLSSSRTGLCEANLTSVPHDRLATLQMNHLFDGFCCPLDQCTVI